MLSFLQAVGSASDLSTYTFSSQNLGVAASNRYIIAAVFFSGASAASVSSVTIGGVTATPLAFVSTGAGGRNIGFYIAAVPTGTTGNVVITLNAGASRAGVALWRAVDLVSASAYDTDTNSSANTTSLGLSIDAPTTGSILAAYGNQRTGGVGNVTISGLTELFDISVQTGINGNMFAGGSDDFPSGATSRSISFGTDINCSGAAAAISLQFVSADLPTLDTDPADDITKTTATLNGEITDKGVGNCTARGFVYDTTSRSDPGDTAPNASAYSNYTTESGSFSEGTFDDGITSLTPNTTYYVRAWAVNADGYAYGDEVSFATLPIVYGISGIVELDNVPVSGATIRCIRQSDNEALSIETTDGSGEYEFTGLEESELYHLAVEYEDGGQLYNAPSQWDVAPVELP